MTARWHEPVNTRRIPFATAVAALLALGANAGIREAGRRWLDAPSDEPLLSLTAVAVATSAAALCAAVTLAALAASQARPFTIFRTTAALVLALSCAPPLVARVGWLTDGQTTTPTMITMLLMHVCTAATLTLLLTTVPRVRTARRL